jgi:hypothetical protein
MGTANTLAAHVSPMPKKVVRKPIATITQP